MSSGSQKLGLVFAIAAGLSIAWVDSRPTWDDTGVSAAALFGSAALATALGVRPWLVALVVAVPVLLAHLPQPNAGLFLIPLVTLAGVGMGMLVRR